LLTPENVYVFAYLAHGVPIQSGLVLLYLHSIPFEVPAVEGAPIRLAHPPPGRRWGVDFLAADEYAVVEPSEFVLNRGVLLVNEVLVAVFELELMGDVWDEVEENNTELPCPFTSPHSL
jgi:hypothetical protein